MKNSKIFSRVEVYGVVLLSIILWLVLWRLGFPLVHIDDLAANGPAFNMLQGGVYHNAMYLPFREVDGPFSYPPFFAGLTECWLAIFGLSSSSLSALHCLAISGAVCMFTFSLSPRPGFLRYFGWVLFAMGVVPLLLVNGYRPESMGFFLLAACVFVISKRLDLLLADKGRDGKRELPSLGNTLAVAILAGLAMLVSPRVGNIAVLIAAGVWFWERISGRKSDGILRRSFLEVMVVVGVLLFYILGFYWLLDGRWQQWWWVFHDRLGKDTISGLYDISETSALGLYWHLLVLGWGWLLHLPLIFGCVIALVLTYFLSGVSKAWVLALGIVAGIGLGVLTGVTRMQIILIGLIFSVVFSLLGGYRPESRLWLMRGRHLLAFLALVSVLGVMNLANFISYRKIISHTEEQDKLHKDGLEALVLLAKNSFQAKRIFIDSEAARYVFDYKIDAKKFYVWTMLNPGKHSESLIPYKKMPVFTTSEDGDLWVVKRSKLANRSNNFYPTAEAFSWLLQRRHEGRKQTWDEEVGRWRR